MIRCEICGEPIESKFCIMLFNGINNKRAAHQLCMHKRINKAFSGLIGTQDDDVAQLVYDAIGDNLLDYTPDEPDGGGHLPPIKEE